VKLVSFQADCARVGLMVDGGSVSDITRSLPSHLRTLEALIAAGDEGISALRSAAREQSAPRPAASLDYLPPVARPGKIIGIGLNYADHAAETGAPIPQEPVVFLRTATSMTGHGRPLAATTLSEQFDYEAELAVIIGRKARHARPEEALSHVFGYTVANDGSIRDYQLRTPQWTLGKNFDETGAIGPVVVTPDELPAGARGLKIEARLNGQVVQSSNTNQLIFDVADLIARLSACMTLEPGDIILTGTPGGVGGLRKPPLWMKPGDVCEIEIEGVATLRNTVGQPAKELSK